MKQALENLGLAGWDKYLALFIALCSCAIGYFDGSGGVPLPLTLTLFVFGYFLIHFAALFSSRLIKRLRSRREV